MIKQYRSEEHVLFIAAFSCLGSFSQGFIIKLLNSTLGYFAMNLKGQEQDIVYWHSLLFQMTTLGAACGCLTMFFLIEFCSRRRTFIIADITTIIGTYFTLLPSIEFLLVGRFLQGLSIGINASLVSVFLREVSPVQIYGKVGYCQTILMALGALLAYIIEYIYDSPQQDAQIWFLQIPIYISLLRIAFFIFYYKYETIIYLIRNLRTQDARFLIDFFFVNKFHVKIEQDTTDQFQSWQNNLKTGVWDPKIITRLFLALCLNLILQLGGINYLIIHSIINAATDDKGINQFSHDNFFKLDMILQFICLGFHFAQAQQSLKIGRLAFLKVGLGACALLNITLVLMVNIDESTIHNSQSNKFLLNSLLYAMILITWSSLEGTIQVYTTEIVPEQWVSLSIFIRWTTASFIRFIYPTTRDYFGLNVGFFMVILFYFLGLALVIKQAKETKGLTAYQVEHAFDKTGKIDYKLI